MKYYTLPFMFFLFNIGCSENSIQITNEYIINKNWTKGKNGEEANSIGIMKMKVKKNSVLNPFTNLNQQELLSNLEYDSSFNYVAVIKTKPEESYQFKKIYFNRDNGFSWWADNGSREVRYIGNLHENTWYEFTRLTHYYYIVYVDSTNKVHPFIINAARNY